MYYSIDQKKIVVLFDWFWSSISYHAQCNKMSTSVFDNSFDFGQPQLCYSVDDNTLKMLALFDWFWCSNLMMKHCGYLKSKLLPKTVVNSVAKRVYTNSVAK